MSPRVSKYRRFTFGKILAVTWVLAIFLPVSFQDEIAYGMDDEIPPIIESGFNNYQESGAEAALKTWLAGSPLEENEAALKQASVFREAEALYGKYRGFEVIQVVPLTSSVKFVYLQMNFQKGPLFTRFTCYNTKGGWVITALNFGAEPNNVIPPELLNVGRGASRMRGR